MICRVLVGCFQSVSALDDEPYQVFQVCIADRRIHAGKLQTLQAANARVTDHGLAFVEELLSDLVVQ